ncbi:MAG: Ribosomal protein [Candidatus Saccharibacteria bacterium]|jgi:small subunit ribosomal protein S8|nr:Ribosomal protein [Candidatus Saccharibacteria bacterium]
MFNDPISDLLTRIRNASTARKSVVVMPYSKLKEQVAGILKDNGFIAGVNVAQDGGFKSLELSLSQDPEAITSLIRVSKPGRRVYTAAKDIPLVLGGRGLVILSTSSGVMTGREARKKGLGGELICKVW